MIRGKRGLLTNSTLQHSNLHYSNTPPLQDFFYGSTLLLELPRQDPLEALYERLKRAPHQHAELCLTFTIFQELQDRGVLDLAKGALRSAEEVLQFLINVRTRRR